MSVIQEPDVEKAQAHMMILLILAEKANKTVDFANLHRTMEYINETGPITAPTHFLTQETNLDLLQKLVERGELFANVAKKAKEDPFWRNRLP